MSNMFEKKAENRNAEQKMIEQAVTSGVDTEKRTTLSLSLTVSDKKALKMIAAERETTIAAIIHEWLQKYLKEMRK